MKRRCPSPSRRFGGGRGRHSDVIAEEGIVMARPKILLVDDSRLFIEMEKEFLQPCAVMIYTARDGREALELVRMVRPDLIYMDLHMPEMDGAECCAALKADPDMKCIPVVMVVTMEQDDDLLR